MALLLRSQAELKPDTARLLGAGGDRSAQCPSLTAVPNYTRDLNPASPTRPEAPMLTLNPKPLNP